MLDLMTPTEAIGRAQQELTALPACIAGSAVSAETYGLPLGKFSDVDVFTFTSEAMIAGAVRLLSAGFVLDDRHERVFHRFLKHGVSGWHTHSLKFHDADQLEVNLVYKKVNKSPLTSLSQVLESFDFGLLGTGYDLELRKRLDLRPYLFPGMDPDGPLPLMPNRRDAWRGGYISQYQGLRELGRYAKYCRRGYDLTLVKEDLIEGYMSVATYMATRSDPEKQMLSKIYFAAADKILVGDLDDLEETGKQIMTLDSLDLIMEALE